MIDRAEQFFAVWPGEPAGGRYHRGDLARIEVPAEAIALLADAATAQKVLAELRQLGFAYVTLDLEGFRSGSMNRVLQAGGLPVVDRTDGERS